MKNGWTGGQYSIFRVAFAVYLFVHFVHLLPWGAEMFSNQGVLADGTLSPFLNLFPNLFLLWDGPVFVTGVLVVASALCILLALGWRDRLAAVLLWYILACLFGRNPLILNPGLPYIGLLLIVHAMLPPAPYGSLPARGRVDPDGGWKLTPSLFAVVWILMAVGYSYSGYTKLVSPSWQDGSAFQRILENPLARPTALRDFALTLPAWLLQAATYGAIVLELAFAPLVCFRKLRPWVWLSMLLMHFGLMVLIDFADLSMGMVMLHFFTFNPDWLPARRAAKAEILFFDGSCGLCHRFIRTVLAEERNPIPIRIAPLHGETFLKEVTPEQSQNLPDSLVVKTWDGQIIFRTQAICYLLHRFGGLWRVAAFLLQIIPAPLRDWGYNGLARIRYRLFKRPADICPLLPERLRNRFEM